MRWISGVALLLCVAASGIYAKDTTERPVPVPRTVSAELQSLIASEPPYWWNTHPQTVREWKKWVADLAEKTAAGIPALREKMGVTVAHGVTAGVKTFTLTPRAIPAKNRDRVLLHFHGGGYVLNPGEAGTLEAVYMAGFGGMKVVSVDYRMPPDFPYPAALDDALAVYRELLKSSPPEKIGVFGTSTGGGMTLALVLRAKAEGLPLPGAIAPGTPWTDMTKTGDTYFTNEGVNNILVSYEGWLREAARLYAGGHDLRDPLLSPVYGDVKGFSPTLLTTGTRDLFLSNTARMHLKLREAGVTADLIVFEGMSHAQYHMAVDAPETAFHFTELGRFFDRHLK